MIPNCFVYLTVGDWFEGVEIGSLAIILAAGIGKRFKGGTGKLFYDIKEKPVISYSLETFDKCSFIDNIIVTYPQGYKKSILSILTILRE